MARSGHVAGGPAGHTTVPRPGGSHGRRTTRRTSTGGLTARPFERATLLALAIVLAVPVASCAPGPVATVPHPAPPRTRPATGPWFVDRARDYGLDLVTRCGSAEKSSVLDSLGAGVALFDYD